MWPPRLDSIRFTLATQGLIRHPIERKIAVPTTVQPSRSRLHRNLSHTNVIDQKTALAPACSVRMVGHLETIHMREKSAFPRGCAVPLLRSSAHLMCGVIGIYPSAFSSSNGAVAAHPVQRAALYFALTTYIAWKSVGFIAAAFATARITAL